MSTNHPENLSGCGSLLAAVAAGSYSFWQLVFGHFGVGAWALAAAWLLIVLAAKNRQLSELRHATKSSP